jgi:catechol 2,3-dioxygenase-like lactoylglutathione lyase family enzyme
MIDFIRADHINICVPSDKLEDASDFYKNVIGLKEIYRPNVFPDPGHWFDIGDITLHIGIEDIPINTTRHTAFEVADIVAAREALVNNHVAIIEEPVIPGRTRFSFYDPFGNRMELLQMDIT